MRDGARHGIIVIQAADFAGDAESGCRFGDDTGGGMQIVSRLIPQEGERRYLVFDTAVDGRELVTTLIVGDQRKQTVSATGAECLKRLNVHHERRFPQGRVLAIEIRIEAHVEARVQAALETAQPGDAIIFWCRDDDLYDAVFPHLGFVTSG